MMLWRTKQFFAWLPVWLEELNEEGHRVKVKRVWLCKVNKFKSYWDGWVAYADDNKHLL